MYICACALDYSILHYTAPTGVSLTDYLKATDPTSIPPECVMRYASYLKSRYKNMCIFPHDWPPEVSTDQQYTELALITNSKGDYFKAISSTMEHDYIHGHIDSIVAKKESIEIHEVFYPIINKTNGESPLTILMDGAPGVGKTTITRKLCQDWARGEILQEYHLVILIPVRFCKLDKISKLFPSESADLTDQVTSYYVNNMGKRILFILDGYDEANAQSKTEQSLLTQLIFGQKLGNCSVLVTSRPYASGYLKSNQCINRYVEVLGFSKKQIEKCIQQNTDQAERLIQMLKERLDIVSLCYIPLNCRIVLFVYKYLDFKLPETLTELYETFILHTVKHHEDKRESEIDRKEEIREAKSLDELPPMLTKNLNSLCELAYNGIDDGKLSFNAKELKRKSLLNLGLMNSYENLTLKNVQKCFQFLHLTIQEFLAAKHLVTLSNAELIDFIRNNLVNIKFRMVLLFVSGLTKLQFVPHGESLATLEHLLADPFTADTEARRQRQQLIIFLAQMFYESQLPSTGNLFLIESNKLDFSKHPLSQFECLVIAHFLSSTAEDYRWEEINLFDSDITVTHIIIVKKHGINSNQLALSMTNSLLVGQVYLEHMFPVLMQGVKELHLIPLEIDHKNFAKLCQLIATHDHIQKVVFSTDYFSKESVELSKECIHVPKSISVCSFSLTYLLCFLSSHKPVSIICPDQEHILTNCSQCMHSGKEAGQKLIAKLAGDWPINCLNLSRCKLSSNTIGLIVNIALNRPVIEKLEIDGNDLTALTMKKVSLLLTRGISLSAHGFHFQPEKNTLKVTDCNAGYKNYTYLVKNFSTPDCFHSVTMDLTDRNIRFIPIWFVTYFLFRNQNIHEFNLLPTNRNFYIECTCEESLSLAETIKSHRCLENLTLPQLVITRNSLSIMGDKSHDSLTKMCTNALRTLLDFLNNEISEYLSIENLPNAFQNCRHCQAPARTTIEKLVRLIANTSKLTTFSLYNCQLSEEQTSLIATSIPTSITLVNLTGNITNRATVNKVLALAEFNLVKLCIDGFTFNVYTSHLDIQCCKDHKPQCHGSFSTLTLPPKLKSIQISNRVKFNLASVVCPLLRNNPQIEDITLGSVETPLACVEAISLAESLNKHTSLQRLSFHFSQKNLITRKTLLTCGLKLCPMSLQKLLRFLDSEQSEKIDLVDEYTAFQDCQHCGACTAGVVTTFLDELDQSKKLKHLDVTNCLIPADVVDSLVTKLLDLSLLEFVSLKDNEVDEQSFIHLLRLFSDLTFRELHLTSISLDNSSLGNTCFPCHFNGFTPSSQIFHCLRYTSHNNNSYHLLHFLESMVNIPLRHKGVEITKAELTSDHAALMEKLICEHETVCSLSLNRCTFTFESAKVFLRSIKTTQTLKGLDLSDNSFTDCSNLLIQILNTIGFSMVEDFYFCSTECQDQVRSKELGESLCASIVNSKCLRNLSLKYCDLIIFNCISEGLPANNTLQSLSFQCYHSSPSVSRLQNRESTKLGKSIDLILKSQSLKNLKLTRVYFDEIVMSHLAASLIINQTIQTLILKALKIPCSLDNGKSLASQIWTTLFEALKQNTTLHTFGIPNNMVNLTPLNDLAKKNITWILSAEEDDASHDDFRFIF